MADTAVSVIDNAALIAQSVADALGVEVSAEVAVAQAPPKPEEPEEPVTLAALLGVEELDNANDNITEFFAKIEEALGKDLESLQTAEEAAAEEQAIQDAANEPIVYQTPTTMKLIQEPSDPQIIGEPFFQV